MQFQGQRSFSMPADALFARLSDAAFLVACIPDATPEGTPSADVALCAVRPGFSFARGSLDVTLNVTSRGDNKARVVVTSKGIGSSADVETSLNVIAADSSSTVEWTATITKLGGLLKAVPAGLIRGAAQKVIDDVWAGVEERLKQ